MKLPIAASVKHVAPVIPPQRDASLWPPTGAVAAALEALVILGLKIW
jgi:hypothetical protein